MMEELQVKYQEIQNSTKPDELKQKLKDTIDFV